MLDGRFRSEAEAHGRVASAASVATDPKRKSDSLFNSRVVVGTPR
jgi:hypothetical protein